MHKLAKMIREAKENGIRWNPEQIEEAENLADAMLEDPEYRNAVFSAMAMAENGGEE